MDHIGDVPVHVIPCIEGRTDGKPLPHQASWFGTIVPAVWSFMLAARTRGLGTCWTTFHLAHEEEAAELLEIPYAEVMQVALVPVAYTIGTDFRPARRKPLGRWCTGTPGEGQVRGAAPRPGLVGQAVKRALRRHRTGPRDVR